MLSRIVVSSRHPLALQAVAEALTSDEALAIEAVIVGTLEPPHLEYPGQLLLLDSCLQPQWLERAVEWQKAGGYVLMLYDGLQHIEQVRSLYLGVRGVVSLSSSLSVELPKAVRTVLKGGLWVSREVLDEYVMHTNVSTQKTISMKPHFTTREEQITQFVVHGYPNKQIASALQISERTVKYHVSNILQKACLATRKELVMWRAINVLDLSRPRRISATGHERLSRKSGRNMRQRLTG